MLLPVLIFGPLILSCAFFLWLAFNIYLVLERRHPNRLVRIFSGQEHLSRIVWRYGIIGYPIFFFAMSFVVFTDVDVYLGRPLFYEGRGPDHTMQSIAFWWILAAYRVGWSVGIVRCRKNIDTKVFGLLAVAVACAVTVSTLYRSPGIIETPSRAEELEICRHKPETQTIFQKEREFFESPEEQKKLKEEKKLYGSNLSDAEYLNYVLEERKKPILFNCLDTLHNPGTLHANECNVSNLCLW